MTVIQLKFKSGNIVSLSINRCKQWTGQQIIIYSGNYFIFVDNPTGKLANFIQIQPLICD